MTERRRGAVGAILVGGTSRRMGRDKARLWWRGATLLERAGRALAPAVDEVIVVGGDDERYGFAGFTVWADTTPDLGPLGGLATALGRAGGRPVFALACDLPWVSTGLIRHLIDGGEGASPLGASDAIARVARCDERLQPLCALYGAGCAEPLAAYLAAGERRAIEFLDRLETTVVDLEPGHPLYRPGLLANVNRPADLETLEAGDPRRSREARR